MSPEFHSSAEYREDDDRMLIEKYGFDADVASYLNRTYGDQAEKVAELSLQGYAARLVDHHPVLEAEIVFAARYELAERVVDVLARRTPLALLDTEASKSVLPRVLEIMTEELAWNEKRREEENCGQKSA